MSDQIQETQQAEVQQTEQAVAKKDNWFLKIWRNKNKRNVFLLACCIVLIMFATMVSSLVQTDGWTATVEDLRNATNSGSITLTPVDDGEDAVPTPYPVDGSVASGILYIPKNATAEHPAPGIVFTHGLFNNREMQLQNAIEMVRRGYVVLVIDHVSHGHNTEAGTNPYVGFGSATFLGASKYLYNLPQVDKTKIGISGHSMGGGATTSALRDDGVIAGTQTAKNFAAGKNMGIISAGLVQANNAPTTIGSNVIAAGVVKASSDEFFFSSTLKEATYVPVARDAVSEDPSSRNYYVGMYLKKGNEYIEQTANDKFRSSKQYYRLSTTGGSTFYLQSLQATAFVNGITYSSQKPLPEELTSMEKWEVVNGGIYANGELVAQPDGRKLVSKQNKGAALANATTSIRAVYEARETHPMNHFSVKSASHIIDFFYNAFGTPTGAKYISPTSQSWWLKEAVSLLGFLGLFGMLFPVLDMLLGTRLFASLKAQEGEVTEGPVLLTRPRKHVSYWLSGILTAIFGAISLKHITAHDNWYKVLGLSKLFTVSEGYVFSNVSQIAAWGIICAIFALIVTAIIWVINRCINVFVYGENASLHDEHPFEGFKIRSWQNVLKTPLLAAILVAMFYLVVDVIWKGAVVDFRIWTFDIRVFDTIKLVSMLKYVPWFFIFYMVTAALSQNYRVKDLPEWATIAINVFFNVIGYMAMIWFCNNYFIANGAMYDSGNNLFFIACYPIIPCVAIATVISRRMYVRTGNAWLSGIVNAVIMTFIACANTSIAGALAWTYGA